MYLGPTRGGHYNEVVLLKRWPLSEVLLYLKSLAAANFDSDTPSYDG